MLHRRAFPQRGASTLGLELGAQLLLQPFVLADAQASAMPARGGRALGAQGTWVTRRRWQLCRLAWDHGDGLATGQLTGIARKSKVKSCSVNSGPPAARGAR